MEKFASKVKTKFDLEKKSRTDPEKLDFLSCPGHKPIRRDNSAYAEP